MSFSFDILFYTPFVFVGLYLFANYIAKTPRNVCVVVLGDIGRSPRMQYHSLSFAKEGFTVYLVGYKGTKPHKAVIQNENIWLHHVREPPTVFTYFPRLVQYVGKVLWQCVMLCWTLLLLPKSSSILLQNPPSIPTMAVCYFVCCVRGSHLVIDWHNYGHTILSMALKASHPLVRFAHWYEKKCAKLSSYNLCVTDAMREDLKHNWGIRSVTVHDRPPDIFKPIKIDVQHNLFLKLSEIYPVFKPFSGTNNDSRTKFTYKDSDAKVHKVDDRPALLVSSTSWTEDEDFGLLLEALRAYDRNEDVDELPSIVCVITGKGPQKEYYKKRIEEQKWRKVEFCLPWLEAEDYPLLLASADIGVSLHTSSSGLDLPMKVVDMYGCGLPVCAANFKCVGELVKHGKNGLVFNNSKELQDQLVLLLKGFPGSGEQLQRFQEELASFHKIGWHAQWRKLVLPIFQVIGGLKIDGYKIPNLDQLTGWNQWDEAASNR